MALVTSCGLTALLTEFARDRGKAKEARLFESWGGKPTTQLLRHRNSQIDAHTKARCHTKLNILLPELRLPTASEEADDPSAADLLYESCVRFLLEQTRDRKQHPLVHKELISYGFRRNLWGMRVCGITLSVLGLVASLVPVVKNWGTEIPPAAILASMLNAGLLAMWLVKIRASWIRPVAFAYARRLLAACDVM